MRVRRGQAAHLVEIPFRVVEIMTGFGIDAPDRADHFRTEQDVVRRNDPQQQLDPGEMVDAGVEEHVVANEVAERRPLQILRQPAVASPVIRHGAAAVGDHEAKRRKVLEEVRRDELHERRGIGVQVMRAGVMEVWITRRADVHHRGHVELHHFLVERIPVAVGERRRRPVAARRIGVEVAADESELVDAAFELANASVGRHTRRLRQLTDTDEVLGVQRADAMNQIIAVLRPVETRRRIADVMSHAGGARREDRHVGASLALELELRSLEARANLVIRDRNRALLATVRRTCKRRDLRLAPGQQRLRRRRVMTVTVDDHTPTRPTSATEPTWPAFIVLSIRSSNAIVGRQLRALDSGSRPSRMASVNSTSWRSNAATGSSGTSLPSLSVMVSR